MPLTQAFRSYCYVLYYWMLEALLMRHLLLYSAARVDQNRRDTTACKQYIHIDLLAGLLSGTSGMANLNNRQYVFTLVYSKVA